ncbi:MAG TPA: hypothetical protein PKE30_14710 [Niabella sp.]|nr:hypothetical protein [Niabella sp.]
MDISKNNQCKMEFYFTREKIETLLKENPTAKGIIISQEIKVRQTAGKETINVVEIKATVDNGGQKMKAMSMQTLNSVDGCPSPPGC